LAELYKQVGENEKTTTITPPTVALLTSHTIFKPKLVNLDDMPRYKNIHKLFEFLMREHEEFKNKVYDKLSRESSTLSSVKAYFKEMKPKPQLDDSIIEFE